MGTTCRARTGSARATPRAGRPTPSARRTTRHRTSTADLSVSCGSQLAVCAWAVWFCWCMLTYRALRWRVLMLREGRGVACRWASCPWAPEAGRCAQEHKQDPRTTLRPLLWAYICAKTLARFRKGLAAGWSSAGPNSTGAQTAGCCRPRLELPDGCPAMLCHSLLLQSTGLRCLCWQRGRQGLSQGCVSTPLFPTFLRACVDGWQRDRRYADVRCCCGRWLLRGYAFTRSAIIRGLAHVATCSLLSLWASLMHHNTLAYHW